MYIKAAGKNYRRDVGMIAVFAGVKPLEGDVGIEIDFYPPDRRKHDWDNILKCCCDSLEGFAYHDDDQIYSGTVEKFKPIKGGKIVVRIWTGCKRERPGKI